MFTEKQLERYADVLLWGLKTARTARFKKNDVILIRYDKPAVRLAEILFAKLMAMGMNPIQRMNVTARMELDFYQQANQRQLIFQPPGDKELFKHLNGSIYLHSPESLTHLRHIDPKKIGKVAVARKYLRDILDKREEKGLLGWTLCIFPTDQQARHAGLNLKEYTHQIIKACFLNRTDPVSHWRSVYRKVTAIKKWLNSLKVKHYRIESETIDLEITAGDKRKWVGISGHNMPSFEIFTTPDWRGTRGRYFANLPSFRSGNIVEGVTLEFKKGAVAKVEARKGEQFVKKQLSIDKGANKLGEFSLTDKRFSRIDTFMANTLFDENFGGKYGNCHVALGSSYSDAYDGDPKRLTPKIKQKLGFNDSALHWDLVNTERKRVTARLTSGKKITIYENGKFAY